MSDYLTKAFKAQLTTTMDSVVSKALLDIMTIFENSLHDHQMELAQKGEEVVQLKMKLQTAELKLRERESEGDKGVATSKTQITETQTQPEDVVNAPGQTSDVPEIDFEVPDDWCAPLGCETVTKKDEAACPSIRLRPLSIPLWHIPVIKEANYRIDSHQQIRDIRRSKRVSTTNEKEMHTQERPLQLGKQGTCIPARNGRKKLLQDIKPEYSGSLGLRQRNITEKEQENMVKKKRKERKKAETKHTGPETEKTDGGKTYTCKFCKKAFNTLLGRNVHLKSHKRCRGCRKDFPFPSALRSHKRYCKKLKKLSKKDALHTNPPQSASFDEEQPAAPSKDQVTVEKEQSHSSSSHSESLIQNDGSTKKHYCSQCNKKFHTSCRLEQHVRLHTGEKPFRCSVCPKKFHINMALKSHMTKMHNDQMNSGEINGDLAWTKPLEDIEDNQEDSISTSDNAERAVNHNSVQRECSPTWRTMGVRNSSGFACLVCMKVVKTRRQLIEHFCLHTGEKPVTCEKCPARFRTFSQLYIHKKRCRFPVIPIQCEKCEKRFCTQSKLYKHASTCQKSWPVVCKICGKGFLFEGRLWNHMERCHSSASNQ